MGGRDTIARIIYKKLAYIEQHPKMIKELPLIQLGTMFGILFDKSQIIQGQATEHVALLSKIDKDIKPEQALDMVLKMREVAYTEVPTK